MIEEVGTFLEVDYNKRENWTDENWKAYSRIALAAFESYCNNGKFYHSRAIYIALENIGKSTYNLYEYDKKENFDKKISYNNLYIAINFIKETFRIIESSNVDLSKYPLRKHEINYHETIFDQIAELIFDIILNASSVTSPQWTCWHIQHNSVWARIFDHLGNKTKAEKIIKFKVRRMIYNEIKKMNQFPNFKGARLLAFSLNILGFSDKKSQKESYPLHKAVRSWIKKNYSWLVLNEPSVASACLVDGIIFDQKSRNIIQLPMPHVLHSGSPKVILNVDPLEN